jgi:O-antigen ligase
VGAVFAPTRPLRLLMLLGVAVHGDAANLSLARGPWLAGAIATIMTFLVAEGMLPTFRARAVALWRLAAATVCLAVVTTATTVLSATVTRIVAARVIDVANISSGTGKARLTLFEALLDDAMDSPIFGHGASAYRQVSELLNVQGSVSENFVLEMFHAGGAMAVVPLLVAALVIGTRLLRSLRLRDQTGVAATCLAGALALVLGALTNPAGWDTAFWVLLGTAAALRPLLVPPALPATPTVEATTR